MSLPNPPKRMEVLKLYLNLAVQYDNADPVVAYYCRMAACDKAIKLGLTSPDEKAFVLALMDSLESTKRSTSMEEIKNDTVGIAHLENVAINVFKKAFNSDKAGNFSRETVMGFRDSGILLDVVLSIGSEDEEFEQYKKYAKFKAVYITRCLKSNETPVAGPLGNEENPMLNPSFDKTPEQSDTEPFTPEPQASSSQPSWPPSQPQPVKQPQQQPKLQPPPPVAYNTEGADDAEELSVDACVEINKCLKIAQSAFTHQDKATTIKNLTRALELLGAR